MKNDYKSYQSKGMGWGEGNFISERLDYRGLIL